MTSMAKHTTQVSRIPPTIHPVFSHNGLFKHQPKKERVFRNGKRVPNQLPPHNNRLFNDVQILILSSARVICSIVHASMRSYPHGGMCKEKKINLYLNYSCFNLEPRFWIFFKD
jgi:hypothetical protein